MVDNQGAVSGDVLEELERLRAENAMLKEQAGEAGETTGHSSGRARNGVAIALILIATLLVALAIPAIWVNRMVTSTDYYVQTVAPLARDAAIQDAVAASVSEKAIQALDVDTRLRSRLPTDLAFLAAPVGNAVDGFVRKQATAFVHSDNFPKLWDRVNEVSHKAFVTAVTGKQTGAVQINAGTITLDVGTLVDQLVARLDRAGLDFVKNLPTGSIDKTVTLYQSDTLAQASVMVDAIQRVALVLPLVAIALLAAAVAIAVDRRRSLLWLGGSLLVWTLLPLQLIYLGQGYVGQKLVSLTSIPSAAAQNAYSIIFAPVVQAEQVFAAIAILVLLAAIVAGPYKWAVAVRTGISGGVDGVASHLELGAFGEWVSARVRALRTAGYLGAALLLLLLPRPRTMSQVIWVFIALVVWVFVVQLLGSGGASRRSDEPVASEPNDVPEIELPAGVDDPSS